MKRRITRISVETERQIIMTQSLLTAESWCQRCNRTVELLDYREAAALLHAEVARVEALLEQHQIHSVEISRGRFLICSNSLPDQP